MWNTNPKVQEGTNEKKIPKNSQANRNTQKSETKQNKKKETRKKLI